MNLRYLVPALGVIAISTPYATADDAAAAASAPKPSAAPVVTFTGWIDTVLTGSNANEPRGETTGTTKNLGSTEIGFANQSSLKANVKINDALSGKINIFINPADGAGASVIDVREAYMSWAINDDWTFQTGKYIDSIGWISPEPTGLYTVNNSLIGYLGIYGNDVIGANIGWADAKKSAFSGSFHVVNGYYDPADASSVTPFGSTGTGAGKSTVRNNDDLGYGLDLILTKPGDDNDFINLDAAYDPHGAIFSNYTVGGALLNTTPITAPADEGGNSFLIGLNGQYFLMSKALMLAAEVMDFHVGDYKVAGTSISGSGGNRAQGMLLANYVLPKEHTAFPMSVTGEVQYIQTKSDNQPTGAPDIHTITTEKASQETLALLTNPTGSTFFALNYEFSLTQYTPGLTSTTLAPMHHVDAEVLSVQALLSF